MINSCILIIDDEPLIRDTMSKDLIDADYEVDISQNGIEGIQRFSQKKYHLVIIDLKMEGMNGIQVSKKIKELSPHTKIIFITGYGSRSSAIDAIRIGASDYFLKPYNRRELLLSVSRCLNDEDFPQQKMSSDLLEKINNSFLSRKEKEVLGLILQGLTDQEISLKLVISINTTKTHVKHIYEKLNIKGRKDLLKLSIT